MGNLVCLEIWPHEEEEGRQELGNPNQVSCGQVVNYMFTCPLNTELECTFTQNPRVVGQALTSLPL